MAISTLTHLSYCLLSVAPTPPTFAGQHQGYDYGGRGKQKTTARAVGLACDALAEQAVPHVALCFAVLFGENPAACAAEASSAATAGGGKAVAEGSKRERLMSRLLGAMEVRCC